MPVDSSRARKLRELAETGDHQGFEDLWIRSIDEAPSEIDSFLAGADALASQGNFDKAGLYLSMLTPALLEQGLYEEALSALRVMANLAPRERGLRHGLLTAYQNLHADNPRLSQWLELSGLTEGKDLKKAIKKLDTFLGFKEGAYVFHPAGWGPGLVTAVDEDTSEVLIDFESRKGHRISLEMAAKVTDFIASDDIRAMKLDRKEEIQRLVEEDPLALIRAGLRSRRGKATQRELKDRFVDDILDAKAWTKWWTKNKKHIKAASDITMTPGSNATLELTEDQGGYAEACLRDLRLLPNGMRRVRYFRDLLKEASTQEDGERALLDVSAALLGPDKDASQLDDGCQISLGFLLRDAQTQWPTLSNPTALSLKKLLPNPIESIPSFPSIPITGHRTAVMVDLRKRKDLDWVEFCEQVILAGEPDTTDQAMASLIREGKTDRANELATTILERSREYPQAFTWYFRAALAKRLPPSLRKEPAPALLEKVLVLHSHLDVASKRDNDEQKKSLAKSIATTLTNREFAFIQEAFESSTVSEANSLATLLKGNRSLNSDIKDKMLAVMFRTRPETAKAGSTKSTGQPTNPLFDPEVLYTTEQALYRKRGEYEDVVNNQIPENAAEIGRAASHGDLSENSEWTAAIEKQERLTRQAEELGSEIGKARLIDPTLQDGKHVTLGSRVVLEDVTGSEQTYTILGPWDVDNSKGFISYLSPLGRALIGHQVDDEILVEVPSGTIHYEVRFIEDGLSSMEASNS